MHIREFYDSQFPKSKTIRVEDMAYSLLFHSASFNNRHKVRLIHLICALVGLCDERYGLRLGEEYFTHFCSLNLTESDILGDLGVNVSVTLTTQRKNLQ
jgi:hypothetical protein